jgi:hypothetical protein
MEAAAKSGADLLWAFQLHREHRALAKRLTAVETNAAQQKDRITVAEQNAHSNQHERVDALTQRLRNLEDAEVTEQVAGLASELRTTRQQLEQARDKVKLLDKASKEADSKARDRDQVVQVRLGEFASVVVQTKNAVHSLEGRLELAVDSAGRTATKAVAASSERCEQQIRALSEQLRNLEQAQGDLRALVESDRRDRIAASIFSVSTGPKAPRISDEDITPSTPSHNLDRTAQTRSRPHTTSKSQVQEQTAVDAPAPQRSSETILPAEQSLIPVREMKPPVANKSKRKRGFTKELTQLIHGDGSLTNAPVVLDSQEPGVSTRGSKRLKAGAAEGRSLRSGLTQPGAPANKIKEEPAAKRAKVTAQTANSKAAKTATEHPTPVVAKNNTQGRKGRAKAKKAPVPRKPLLPTSDEIQVFRSPSAFEQAPLPSGFARAPLLMKSEKTTAVQHEQRSQQRRRRIEQDDSMEEFMAKCEAATEM